MVSERVLAVLVRQASGDFAELDDIILPTDELLFCVRVPGGIVLVVGASTPDDETKAMKAASSIAAENHHRLTGNESLRRCVADSEAQDVFQNPEVER